MKNIFVLLAGLLFLTIAAGCKKKQPAYPKVPPPSWSVSDAGSFSSTMTLVVVVPENLLSEAGERKDQISAFINGQCRGIGTPVDAGSLGKEFFIMVHGDASENAMISIKYYCAKQSRLYGISGLLPFKADGADGSIDHPMKLDLQTLP